MNNLTVIKHNDINVVDSREVAAVTGKRHSDLLESIGGYIQHLENGNFRSHDFFIPSNYRVESNRKIYDCYLLTRKGCDMVANKMTGEKGVLFTAAYVTKFEEMEKQIKQPIKLSPMDQLRLQYEVLEEQQKQIQIVDKKIDDLESSMPLFNTDCKELQKLVRKVATQALGGYKSIAYNDKSLRGRVYSDIQKQLRREFGVDRYESIKRCQFEKAKEIVANYRLPLVIEDEIVLANQQLNMLGA